MRKPNKNKNISKNNKKYLQFNKSCAIVEKIEPTRKSGAGFTLFCDTMGLLTNKALPETRVIFPKA